MVMEIGTAGAAWSISPSTPAQAQNGAFLGQSIAPRMVSSPRYFGRLKALKIGKKYVKEDE